jgi:hypothetical protein
VECNQETALASGGGSSSVSRAFALIAGSTSKGDVEEEAGKAEAEDETWSPAGERAEDNVCSAGHPGGSGL